MGLYDRDYMRERKTGGYSGQKPSGDNTKLIIAVIIAFILGFILGKII
ncbi:MULTISPECIES: hypothetical protein [unclassified Persephonella]|nr:hypothetical protein [Persephonella sp. KM09-Lau-8]